LIDQDERKEVVQRRRGRRTRRRIRRRRRRTTTTTTVATAAAATDSPDGRRKYTRKINTLGEKKTLVPRGLLLVCLSASLLVC